MTSATGLTSAFVWKNRFNFHISMVVIFHGTNTKIKLKLGKIFFNIYIYKFVVKKIT